MAIKTVVSDAGKFNYDRFHFADATEADGFLFCSGIIGSDTKGGVSEDAAAEFRAAWTKVGDLLREAGAGYADILECTTYHVGLQAHLADFMAVRDEFLSEPWPAWTAIGISELAIPGARVEIRVTARLPD